MSSPTGAQSHSAKRKYEADAAESPTSTAFKLASATEIHLPNDPMRRASIINLATAAAAAVLQSQAGQRRMSAHPEQEQKRQRVEQLGMLIEQARKASVTSMSHDMSRHIETASQNVAIATVLANHLGLTPQSSAPSSPAPSAGPSAPSSPTKPLATLAVPPTPSTPKSPLSAAPFTAAHVSEEQANAQDVVASSATVGLRAEEIPPIIAAPPSPARTPSITLNNSTESIDSGVPSDVHVVEPPLDSSSASTTETILDQAKEAALDYSRFYRFEKEWAQKALELERRRSSVRIDPLFNPNPSLSPLPVESKGPLHSAPESRAMSRGNSPFGEAASAPASRTSNSVPNATFPMPHRPTSSSLANVLSNFAELIEHRQRSCSSLEALAKQAKELPIKRFSQPNPQFRTTFGDFSWAKPSRSATDPASSTTTPSRFAPPSQTRAISEGDDDSDASSDMDRAQASRSSRLQVKSSADTKIKDETADSDGDAPATPRSSMSIASML
ncbi:hypothetical protein PSEUBRA_004484 [Kalmanozyma brasiliensis GHG001]|uniref:uncharacterized protein n=1 Tax=Kalmanozyma brasiliensis (strain GHG001) TaxID=1365824 RepID=UPI0028681BAE|nr:uncharacterized protein PSEUBRA_004484 [Kalmanozyma brasiliensis GHG001]EST06574.2 hypothetical protein PSEUBRA_004484 [Kalmanozyma brasiliensis GHG001]